MTVHNGEQLLHLLESMDGQLPDVLFLDLNMPRINGWQCLEEIKRNDKLKLLHVVIFSTSFHQEVADQLFKKGALHYIRKPSAFGQLKSVIHQVLLILQQERATLSAGASTQTKASFVLS